uniref:Glutathione S-transferase kappa n=1 Tax=Pardosa pseudoannulata TaxID=330961 RepID=A0A5Q0QVH2_9ARAC|nr:glutathione transferase kappa 1 [Pardosa pseudoannulata]
MANLPVLTEFFYDVLSPYSYLAFEVIHRYKPVWNINLKLKPMLLGRVMKSSGNSPPGLVPNKRNYMGQDLKRLQKYFQVPLFLPDNLMDFIMKGGSVNAQRFITAIDILKPEYLENITRAIWQRLYEQHKDISTSASFREAAESIGIENDVLERSLIMMNEDKVEQRLHKYTEEALDYGAFGAPMIVAHINNKPEVFFGSDRFELLAHVLGKKWLGPVPKDAPFSN